MKKHSKHSFLDQPAYKKWVLARDRALEDLHTNAQLRASDILRAVFIQVLHAASSYYGLMKAHHTATHELEQYTKQIFSSGADQLFHVMEQMRVRAYTLAKASEAEIIAQLLKRPVKAKVDKSDLDKIKSRKSFAGGPMYARISLYMDRLRRHIISAAQSSALNAPDQKAFMLDVAQAFPKRRVVKRPKRILKPALMEADQTISKKPPADVAIDNIDPQAWDDMLADYKSDVVPQWRQPEYVVDIPITDPTVQATTGEEVWYAWEFERDLTNEFVKDVRDGQVDAATDNGITDFVWIAVVDSVTDECCLWRDGLLTSEIEDQLDDHQGEDDECNLEDDGLVPPIHFNCFTAGHKITTDSGERLIEDIRPGDMVLTHMERFRRITKCLQSESNRLMRITLADGRMIECTLDHPFWNPKELKWMMAGGFSEGEDLSVLSSDHENGRTHKELSDISDHEIYKSSKIMDRSFLLPMQIVKIEIIEKPTTVYNFSVDEDESYFADGVLSHNCRCSLAPASDEIPDKPDDGAAEFDDWLNS